MKTGVMVLNFGEPEQPTLGEVVPFLERIFHSNASLEAQKTEEARRARSRQLAEARAPGLVAEYEQIGGSPLNAQARRQAVLLQAELRSRGLEATCHIGMQFTEPSIGHAVRAAQEEGAEVLVGLPVYPLCGRSTTVTALATLREEVDALAWEVPVLEISGWHAHEDYARLHADHVRQFAGRRDLDLTSPRVRLVFSAHGTPLKFLDDGNRYDRYVDEICRTLASELEIGEYTLGFQNHGNRPIEWTQPDIDAAVEGVDADDVVVVAVSFMHEQSETLAELDEELREHVEGLGMGFHRVPIPFDAPRFIDVLADLVVARLEGPGTAVGGRRLKACRCRTHEATCCLNQGA